MANGKIRFGKQSGGELALVIPDGVTNTEVVVPESGILATKQYADTKVEKVTSTDNAIVRFNGSTGEVQNSSVSIDDNGNLRLLNTNHLNLGADKGGGATIAYSSNGNLDITPRSGYNTTFTDGNVGIGMTNNGADRLQVNGSIGVVGSINITSTNISGGSQEITKEVTLTFDNYGGTGILKSVFGDVPTCGELYVYEIGTENYLNATFFKRGAFSAIVVTVLASNGLTLGAQNSGGTQVVDGATDPNNIRMMSKIRKLYT